MGIDDFVFSWEENTDEGEKETNLFSLDTLPNVDVTKKEWENGYKHPEKVGAVLVSGETMEAAIDQATWTCEPEFNKDVPGWYTRCV